VQLHEVEAARRERAARRTPRTFPFGGQTFTLLPVVPIGLGFDLMDAPEPADDEAGAARALAWFIRECLASEEEQARWDAVLRDRTDPIDPQAIIELGACVAEVYAAPFASEPSAASAGGRPTSGKGSRPTRGPATKRRST
jgi:hypothetical protein